jgi:hypothetical protein
MAATTPENRNHVYLSRLHIALASAYAILFGSMQYFELGGLTESGKFAVNILSICMPLLHIGLAWSCKKKSEISRKVSQIVGALMLIWLPIGPIFGFFFIRFSDWKSLPSQKIYAASASKMQSSLHKAGIGHRSLQKYGVLLSLISPLAFAIIVVDGLFGLNIFSDNMVLGGHWLAIAGMLTLTPIGLLLIFMGSWIGSGKVESQPSGDTK